MGISVWLYTAGMSSVQNGRFIRADLWREGEWLDLWSVVHVLSGTSLGLVFYLFHFGTFAPAVLALVLLISYEMWEMIVKIEETPSNRVMDVVVGMVGYVLSFFVLVPQLTSTWLLFVTVLVILTDIGMSIVGWRASQKAAALKTRMLDRYATQRARLLKQKKHFQRRFKRQP